MKKLEIKKSFKTNKFRYGGYATVLTSMVLLILLIANLVVDKLDLRYDMTRNKLYSLSDQSYKVMDNLKKDIKIITFYRDGSENPGVEQVLSKYQHKTKKITLQNVDPNINPQLAKKYSAVEKPIKTGSIVVESGNKFKVISESELYNTSIDEKTGKASVKSLAVEERITGAIMYIESEINPVVYALKGHDEIPLATEVTQKLTDQNVEVKPLNLSAGDSKLNPGDVLIVSGPSIDITKEEGTKLKDFFSTGGRGVFLMDLQAKRFANFDDLMSSFGVEINPYVILEMDAQHYYQNLAYLVPIMNSHAIADPMISAKLPILVPVSQSLKQLNTKKDSIKIEALLTTTDKSWGKKNTESTATEKEAGDIDGPFDVALAITDTGTKIGSKIVIFGTSGFIDSQIIGTSGGDNLNYFMNTMNWIQDLKQNISITPKDLTSKGLKITRGETLGYSAVVIIIIPSIVLILGVVVWLRRKNL